MKIFRFAQKNKALRALGDFGVSNFRDTSVSRKSFAHWVPALPRWIPRMKSEERSMNSICGLSDNVGTLYKCADGCYNNPCN